MEYTNWETLNKSIMSAGWCVHSTDQSVIACKFKFSMLDKLCILPQLITLWCGNSGQAWSGSTLPITSPKLALSTDHYYTKWLPDAQRKKARIRYGKERHACLSSIDQPLLSTWLCTTREKLSLPFSLSLDQY